MKDFKDYFKFPLQMDKEWGIKVYTSDKQMAFDWLLNIPHATKLKIISILNGEITLTPKVKKEWRHENGILYCKFLEGENGGNEYHVMRIRGWGMLTGIGGYNLPSDEATQIQDDFADYCINILNNN
jgi:hypothetical protein